jgi:hypothetical protein
MAALSWDFGASEHLSALDIGGLGVRGSADRQTQRRAVDCKTRE